MDDSCATYTPKKPCKRGHWLRFKSSKACVQCLAEWKTANREKIRVRDRELYVRKVDKERARKKVEYAKDPLRRKEINRAWRVKNPAKSNAITAKRRAIKLNATPAWLVAEDYDRISAMYAEAARLTRETGIVHHVDHIIPLQGKSVSGLHVPWNLRVITASANASKGNKLDVN